MPLIPNTAEAVIKTQEWLEKNAPDFVYETYMQLVSALTDHTELANLQSQLNNQYGGLVEDIFKSIDTQDIPEEGTNRITGRLKSIQETNIAINNYK